MSRRDDASEDRRLVVPIATCVAVLCFLFGHRELRIEAAQKSSAISLRGRGGAATPVAVAFERVAERKVTPALVLATFGARERNPRDPPTPRLAPCRHQKLPQQLRCAPKPKLSRKSSRRRRLRGRRKSKDAPPRPRLRQRRLVARAAQRGAVARRGGGGRVAPQGGAGGARPRAGDAPRPGAHVGPRGAHRGPRRERPRAGRRPRAAGRRVRGPRRLRLDRAGALAQGRRVGLYRRGVRRFASETDPSLV